MFRQYAKQVIIYCTLFCFLVTSQLSADGPCCEPRILVDQNGEEGCRSRAAVVAAGATAVAFVGVFAWLALGSSCHKHRRCGRHRRHCSYDDYDCHNHRRGRRDRRHCHRSRSESSNSVSNDKPLGPGVQDFLCNNLPPTTNRSIERVQNGKESAQISGEFITHPSFSSSSQGSMTAFVRLPDGSTQVLGSIPFSSQSGSALSYGPFTQKGNYLFGVSVDDGTILSSQAKVGSVEVKVDGSTVQSHDFFVPAHSPSNYEPNACEYTLP